MKLWLDTQLLLRAAAHPRRLPAAVRKSSNVTQHESLFSAASFLPISLKISLGRADFRVEPRGLRCGLMESGHVERTVTREHSGGVVALPDLHRDALDRLPIAQATCKGITLVTADAVVGQYPGQIRRV